jgi:hypothetical protein
MSEPVSVEQHWLVQSALELQVCRQTKPPSPSPAQAVPAQQFGRSGPHAAPTGGQVQKDASTQKPPPFANGWQQPVEQSALVLHSGRQPAKAGVSDLMQSPLQQLLSDESVFWVQSVSARFLQGVSHAAFGLQMLTPTSFGSVQQPVSGQSALVLHVV